MKSVSKLLVEFLTLFCQAGTGLRERTAILVRTLVEREIVRVIPQSRESFLSGLHIYAARGDKGYSMTDCISMATMRREGIRVALTNDRHFEQEGFEAAFRESR